MEENLKISVIVPVYNVEKYLDDCISSIVNQTYKNLEIILVDDGSSDNSPQICNEWAEKDSRIKVIHKENGGVSSARNAGLDVASGEYIGFVDGDDFIDEKMYSTMLENILEKNADICSCNFFRVNSTGNIINATDYQYAFLNGEKVLLNFLLPGMDSSCNKLYLNFFIQENERRFDTQLKYGEDTMFNYYCAKKAKSMVVINETFYNYRQVEDSAVHTVNRDLVMRWEKSTKIIYENEKNNKNDNIRKISMKNHLIILFDCMKTLICSNDKELISEVYKLIIGEIKKHAANFIRNDEVEKVRKIKVILASCLPNVLKAIYSLYFKIKNVS